MPARAIRTEIPFRVLIALLVALTAGPAAAAPTPATTPASPATRPAAAALSADERKALEKKVMALTRRAIDLLQKNKTEEAEPVLLEALSLDPQHITNLYNYACLLAIKGKSTDAVLYLEKAAEAGWTDFVHLNRDPDLASLRELPAFQQLLGKKPVYQKRSAERVVASLKQQFGDGYVYDLDEERKLIFATNTDRATVAALKQWLTAQATSQWNQLFEHKLDHYVSVVVPSAEDYRKLVKMPGVGGYYDDQAKLLICQRMGQTMTHEFTHALHAADMAALGQEHPIWIVEGLASLYEAARFEGDKLVPQDNFRLNLLQRADRRRQLLPLAHLVTMKQPEFVKKATLAYGQSGSLMLYLYEKGLLRDFYDTYKKTYNKDSSGKLALEKVTKLSLPEIDKAWRAWMIARTPVPSSTGSDGAVIGARLADGNDGIRIDEVVPGGPADKAGVRNGDVLVGIADAQVRDYPSLVPMMVQFKPGDEVVFKIRRDGKYLDLPITLGKRSDVVPPSRR